MKSVYDNFGVLLCSNTVYLTSILFQCRLMLLIMFYVCISKSGDAMTYSNGQAFTTRDQDNDQHSSNCAVLHNTFSHCNPQSCDINAGWWYNNCGYSYLNSPYGTVCFLWYYLPGSFCNVKFSEMKIRPV